MFVTWLMIRFWYYINRSINAGITCFRLLVCLRQLDYGLIKVTG